MSELARALLREIEKDPEALRRLAESIQPHITIQQEPDRWLDVNQASWYLCMTPKALRRRIEMRSVDENPLPVHQERPGAKLWFRRSDLDEWRSRSAA